MPPEFVEPERMVMSLLALKEELVRSFANRNLVVNTQEILEKLNLCLYNKYPQGVKK